MPITFQQAGKAIPELLDLDSKIEVVIIGYNSCPYSAKALAAKNRHPKWKHPGHVAMAGYEFGEIGPFKHASGYQGTFPIVFVLNLKTKQFEYVGGGTDFERYVENSQ